jgi:hypothetical protein
MATTGEFIQRLKILGDRPNWSLFEPSQDFYSRLTSGEDADLVAAAKAITDHIAIPPLLAVTYEWGLLMPASAAGRIHIKSVDSSKIQIPLFYVGKPFALGAILAHELTHQLLALHGIWDKNEAENEQLTDAASFMAGLGKLVLNGSISEIAAETGETELLGYLDLPTRIDLYNRIADYHAIQDSVRAANLTPRAVNLFLRKSLDQSSSR